MLDALAAHWPLKLLALGLAFAIWVSVTGENRVVQDFEVPLEIRLAEGLVLASDPPTTVDVRLRGLESVMRRLDPVPMVVDIDLRDAPPGDEDVLLPKEALKGVPRGVEVDFIDPDRTELVIEPKSRRELPVEPTFLGQPPEGFAYYGARLSPNKLTVEGPASKVDSLEVLRTRPIRLDGRVEPFVVRVGVVPEDSRVRLVARDSLDVAVIVDAAAVERRLEGLPVQLVGAPPGTSVDPAKLNVTISGPPHLVDQLTPERVRLVVDVTRVPPETASQDIAVRVEFADFNPDEEARLSVVSISRREVHVALSGRRSL